MGGLFDRATQRGDLHEKRKRMMAEWAKYALAQEQKRPDVMARTAMDLAKLHGLLREDAAEDSAGSILTALRQVSDIIRTTRIGNEAKRAELAIEHSPA